MSLRVHYGRFFWLEQQQQRTRLYSSTAAKSRRRKTLLGLLALSSAASGLILYTTSSAPQLNAQTFTPFTLTAKTPLPSGTSTLFTLHGPVGPSWPDIWRAQRIYSVHVAREEMAVWRKYTPLLGGARQIQLLVSPHPAGCVSPHLHGLALGARVLVRGPFVEYEIPRGVEEVVCLVGGTGVACAMQVVEGLLERGVKMRVVWAVRDKGEQSVSNSSDDNPILARLHHLKSLHPAALTVSTHTDHTPSALKPAFLLPLLSQSPSAKKLLLVAGPPGFVEYWVGAKVWDNSIGEEGQGSIGGVLGRELVKRKGEWMVWKL
jgi:NAD(P)H-flavin reductase